MFVFVRALSFASSLHFIVCSKQVHEVEEATGVALHEKCQALLLSDEHFGRDGLKLEVFIKEDHLQIPLLRRLHCGLLLTAGFDSEAVRLTFLTVPFVLVNDLAQFYHNVLNSELFKLYIDVEAPLHLTNYSRAADAPRHIRLADGTDARVIICWVEHLSLLFYRQFTKHLVELVVSLMV